MQAGKDYAIVDFDPMKHTAFLFDSFRKSLNECWVWKLVPVRMLIEKMKKQIRTPGTVTKVAVGIPDSNILMGWACCRPASNEVVYAFTKYEQRRFGIAGSLAAAAGVNLRAPTGVLYWTHAAQRIACKGYRYPLFFRLTEASEPFTYELYAVKADEPAKPKKPTKAA
jgi:hypothetical protein